MLKFPDVTEPVGSKPPKMSLLQYVEFCEFCVRSNPLITPENCLKHDSGEREIKEAFRFPLVSHANGW